MENKATKMWTTKKENRKITMEVPNYYSETALQRFKPEMLSQPICRKAGDTRVAEAETEAEANI